MLRVVGRPSQMSGSGREALPNVREWLGNPPGCPGSLHGCLGVVGSPSQKLGGPLECLGLVRRLSQMSESGLEALPDVQELSKALPDVWDGREAIPNVRKWLGVPPGCPGVVRRPSRMSGSGRKAISNNTVEAHCHVAESTSRDL